MRKVLNDLIPVSVLRNITIYAKEDTYFLEFFYTQLNMGTIIFQTDYTLTFFSPTNIFEIR